jgi:hypothetical protein
MPTWGAFVRSADQTPPFANYRRLVQLLTWKNPVPDGGFLVLKAPQIANHIETFAAVFPEARFVVPDRDPYRCVISMAVMGRSIIDPFCLENPVAGPGIDGDDSMLEYFSIKLDALLAFEQTRPERITHLPYPALLADPAGAVSDLAAGLGLPDDPGHRDRIVDFLAAQRAGKRAAPPNELETLGYDLRAVLAEPSIARYCERYGIDPEGVRLTG